MKKTLREWCNENNFNELLEQWQTKENLPLTPDSLSYGSEKQINWKCTKCGNVWKTKLCSRTGNKTSCPICAKDLRKQNTLITKLASKGSLEEEYPQIIKEWDFKKNSLKPNEVTSGSNKKVWWICSECNNSYVATVNSRTLGSGCPICKNKKRIKTMIEKNGSLYDFAPHLSEEWHPTKNVDLVITKVTPSSNKKVWWKCKKGHEWEASPATRLKGHGCPICSGMIVTKENCLAIKNPELAKEWHPTKNGTLTPYDVGAYSEKRIWWLCKNGHEWQQTVSNRNQGRGCSKCSFELKTSFPEQAVLFYLNKYFEIDSRKKINNWEADLYLPKYDIAIEYDGIVYHSNDFIKEREKRKEQAFLEKNIQLIRIKESYDKEGIEDNIIYFKVDSKYSHLNVAILLLFQKLEEIIDVKFEKNIDLINDKLNIINQYYKLDKKNNFSEKYPQLVIFWNYEKNLNLKPENFKAMSNEKVWWKCPKCNGEWLASVINVAKGNRCPYCSGHKVLKGYNDLATKKPELAKEWNESKNKICSCDVTLGSNKKVWWICSKCKYEWKASPTYRNHHSNCPKCSGSINRSKTNYYKNDNWLQMYEYAKHYYKLNGNLEVPAKYVNELGVKLGSWIRTQRVSYQNDDLLEERKLLLNEIGMIWKIKK